MKRATHRSRREYPNAPIHRTEVPLKTCPFCAAALVDAGWREIDKYVQTLNGAVHVAEDLVPIDWQLGKILLTNIYSLDLTG